MYVVIFRHLARLPFSICADRRPEHVDIGQLEAENDKRVNHRHSVDGQWVR